MVTGGNYSYCGYHFVMYKITNHYDIHLKLIGYCCQLHLKRKEGKREGKPPPNG